MHPGSSSRERRRVRMSRKNDSDSNESDEADGKNVDDYLDYSRTYSPKTRSSSGKVNKKKRRTNEEVEDYFSPGRHRTKSASRDARLRSVDSAEDIQEDDIYSSKDKDVERRKRRSSKGRNGDRSLDRKEVRELSSKKNGDGGKRKRKKRHSEESVDSNEIPIVEILKKAQEYRRTKYEDPIPLPELTTNTIYVQGRNGFSAMKMSDNLSGARRRSEHFSDQDSYPIRSAIVMQKVWRYTGIVFQGLLSGMCFLHFILMQTVFADVQKLVPDYTSVSEIYTNFFSFLIIMSIISVIDKFDLAHADGSHLRDIYQNHAKSAFAVPLYLLSFFIHLVTLKVEDKLTLNHFNHTNSNNESSIPYNVTNADIQLAELMTWQRLALSKDALAVFAWLFVSVGSRNDMFLMHLQSMAKYIDNSSPPM